MKHTVKIPYSQVLQIDPLTNEVLGSILRPYILVKISLPNNNQTAEFKAMIDSGADYNLVPATFGKFLGIDFNKIPMKAIFGIGSSKIIAYESPINLWVGNKKLETFTNFSFEQKLPILGRVGFFDLFEKIVFNEFQKCVELIFKS